MAMKKTNSVSPTYFVVVVEDTSRKVVVGTATLVLEQKFIRGASVAGHVEDVVTDKSVRGKGIGKVLMEALLSLSRQMGCYKTMLDCDEKNVPFYSQFGFKPKVFILSSFLCFLFGRIRQGFSEHVSQKERQMAIYFEQQQKSKL